jgi:hypothetical protein
MIPGPIGMVASVAETAGYLVQGNYKGAAVAASGIALAAVGAGVAKQAIKGGKIATTATKAKLLFKPLNEAGFVRIPGASRTITGYSVHALGRMAGTRGGPQMSPQAVEHIVKYGSKTKNVARNSYEYNHKFGKAILNSRGRVITVISKSRYTRWIR